MKHAKKPVSTETIRKVMQWFASGEKGISSECIASIICGFEPKWNDTPSDPDDFKRCLLLLNDIPELREHLYMMRSVSTDWDKLMNHWDDIEESFMSEVPEWLYGDYRNGAPKTYALMSKCRVSELKEQS